MQPVDVARAFLAAIENLDEAGFNAYTGPDFQMVGPTPQPFNRAEAWGLSQALVGGIPDWQFNLDNMQEQGDTIAGHLHIKGTHTRPLNLAFLNMNLPPLVPTGLTVVQPAEETEFKIVDGKVAVWRVESGKEGGVPGLLRQLGVNLPVPA